MSSIAITILEPRSNSQRSTSGHSLNTTMAYAQANLDLKRQALMQVFPDAPRPPRAGRVSLERLDVAGWLRHHRPCAHPIFMLSKAGPSPAATREQVLAALFEGSLGSARERYREELRNAHFASRYRCSTSLPSRWIPASSRRRCVGVLRGRAMPVIILP
jgi:hypothetical protein